jgi:hypothetical protein
MENNNQLFIQILVNNDDTFEIYSNMNGIKILGYLRYCEKKIWLDMITISSTNVNENNIKKELKK